MGMVIWLSTEDMDPPHGIDMSSVRDSEAVFAMVRDFETHGFDKSRPALIGYPLNGRIQLLSGSHRYVAAQLTGTKLPVTLWLQSDIHGSWGSLEEWARVMRDIPVAELETWTREDIERARLKVREGQGTLPP